MHVLVEAFSTLHSKAAVMLQKLKESQPGEVHKKTSPHLDMNTSQSLGKEVNEITKQINKHSNRGD